MVMAKSTVDVIDSPADWDPLRLSMEILYDLVQLKRRVPSEKECLSRLAEDLLILIQKLSPEELSRQPLAGALLSMPAGVAGLPDAEFAG